MSTYIFFPLNSRGCLFRMAIKQVDECAFLKLQLSKCFDLYQVRKGWLPWADHYYEGDRSLIWHKQPNHNQNTSYYFIKDNIPSKKKWLTSASTVASKHYKSVRKIMLQFSSRAFQEYFRSIIMNITKPLYKITLIRRSWCCLHHRKKLTIRFFFFKIIMIWGDFVHNTE